MTLYGTDTYTGTTEVDAGTLYLGNITNVIAASSGAIVASGATLDCANSQTLKTLTLKGGTLANTIRTGTWYLAGDVTISARTVASTISSTNCYLSKTASAVKFDVAPGGTASGIDLNVTGRFQHYAAGSDSLIKWEAA